MAKIPQSVVGKFVRFSYKLNHQIRSGGYPQYEMKIFVRGPWSYEDIFNNQRRENKISHSEADAVFNFMRYYGQLRREPNSVGYTDWEGEMNFSPALVSEYNKNH